MTRNIFAHVTRIVVFALGGSVAPAALAAQAAVQASQAATDVDSLVAHALAVNPGLQAAIDRIEAARARIGPAGALPDPVLAVGIANLPISDPGFDDFMTMKMVSVGQTLPYPGKLSLARRAAQLEQQAAQARAAAAGLDVAADVRKAYYDLAFHDRTLDVLRNTQKLLVNFIGVNEARYAVGSGGQQDILKARVEAARLAEDAVRVSEERRATLARLNALLDRASDTPVTNPVVADRIARAAVPDSGSQIRFASAALGGRAANSPLPALTELQERAIANSPMLRAHEAEIAAQSALLELAGKAHLPDFDLSLQYGQRNDRTDMVSFVVAVPLPLHNKSRQAEQVAEARAQLAALQAEHHVMVNRLRTKIAVAYAAIERDRAQLALFVIAIIPQGRAALESATSAFQVGRADFLTLLDSQTTLYSYETEYFRSLTDFAKQLAELERVVGSKVL